MIRSRYRSHGARAVRAALAVGCALTLVVACEPVEPVVTLEDSTFEGFAVVSYVPDDPVGIVHWFHGSGGSTAFARKVESVAVLNELIDRGYAVVATESTERTGNRRWDVFDPSIETNPDLARVARLHAHVVANTNAESTTPILGVGMSNGARFATRFAQTFADEGFPVRAVAAYMGRVAPGLTGGGLTVPTQFVLAENDTTVPNATIVAEHEELANAGTPTELRVGKERRLSWGRFLRIPGIDGTAAQATFDALVATGIWDEEGNRIVGLEEVENLAAAVQLPPEVAGFGADIRDQAQVVLAVHEFRSDFAARTADFFDTHVGAT